MERPMPNAAIPDHVPPALVYDFDIWKMPAHFSNPHDYWLTLRDAKVPRIFYTPHHGGHWMLHHFDDTLEGYRDTDFFTNFPNGIPARPGGATKLIPVEIDPPEHVKYRNVLGPAFSPVAVKAIQDGIRSRVAGLIDAVAGARRCDFAGQIAGRLPTSVFLHLMGMPMADFDEIMEMEHRFLRGPDQVTQKDGADRILAYVAGFIEAQAAAPGENVTGVLLRARDEHGQPWSREEIINTAFLLYVAGLDTVTNMMSFIWYYLAKEPAKRRHVAANLGDIPKFVDELMRLGVPAVNARRVRRDGIWRGVVMKAGDAVLNAPMNANRDPAHFPDPDVMQWDRPNTRQQIGFGAGPHRCVGQHLARQEIIITLEEWFKRIPEFALDPDVPLNAYLGNIMGFANLPLVWSAA
jgi:cytochrome P450